MYMRYHYYDYNISKYLFIFQLRSGCIQVLVYVYVYEISLLLVYISGAFWLYTGFGICGLVFISLLLPETKGKSLEEVELLFKKPIFSTR